MPRHAHRRHLRLIALAAGLAMAAGLVVAACGGGAQGDPGQSQEPAAAPPAQATKSPEPVSSLPPLVNLGEAVRFMTPEGAVVRVTAGRYTDPGDAPDGMSAEAGERLVTLELTVTAEGPEGTAAVKAPFRRSDSFLLIAEDDTITAALLADDALLGAILPPGEPLRTTLAFSVGSAAQRLFVCTPADGSRPRSATWELN